MVACGDWGVMVGGQRGGRLGPNSSGCSGTALYSADQVDPTALASHGSCALGPALRDLPRGEFYFFLLPTLPVDLEGLGEEEVVRIVSGTNQPGAQAHTRVWSAYCPSCLALSCKFLHGGRPASLGCVPCGHWLRGYSTH